VRVCVCCVVSGGGEGRKREPAIATAT